jgi:hypothetical protein
MQQHNEVELSALGMGIFLIKVNFCKMLILCWVNPGLFVLPLVFVYVGKYW